MLFLLNVSYERYISLNLCMPLDYLFSFNIYNIFDQSVYFI